MGTRSIRGQQRPKFSQAMINLQESLVRPKHIETCQQTEEVEAVDGMDVTVRADASGSEYAVVEF